MLCPPRSFSLPPHPRTDIRPGLQRVLVRHPTLARPLVASTWRSRHLAVVAALVLGCGDGTGPDTPAPVASVDITGAPIGPAILGVPVQLTAVPKDDDGNALMDRDVMWRSSNASAASVTGAGLVTGLVPGVVTITATSEEKEGTASIDFRVGGVLGAEGGSISVLGGAVTLAVPAGALLQPSVVTIAPAADAPADDRLLAGTAFALGPATMSFAQPATISLRYDPALANGESLALYTVVEGAWRPVAGSTVNTETRRVSASIDALGTFALLVAPVDHVVVSGAPASGELYFGQSVQLVATAYDAGDNVLLGRPFTWTSSNGTIASVSSTGRVTAHEEGDVTITATSAGKSGSVTIGSRPAPVASVTLGAVEVTTLYPGATVQLQATLKDASGVVLHDRTIEWTSSNAGVAAVDADGNVAAVAPGAARITATSEGRAAGIDFRVIAGTTADWSGASDWATFQGNASHTGHVPVTADPRVFQPRWTRSVGPEGALNPPTVADGHVLLSTRSYFGQQRLTVLDVATGTPRWSYDFGDIHGVHPPAYGDGHVYLTTSGHEDSFLWSFDAADGSVRFRSAYGNQWSSYFAPVVVDGKVYMAGGYYGGMYRFDAVTGEQDWFREVNQYDQWTPAVRDGLVYAYTGSYSPKVSVADAATGAIVYEIADPNFSWNGWSMNTAPVLGASNNLLAIQANRLVSFDLANRRIGWERTGTYAGSVTVAGDVLYVVNNSQLEARRASDGSLVWTWVPPQGQATGTLLVTDNLAFVSTATRTYAVDLASRTHVWAHPSGGHLALGGDGTLIVAQPNGIVAAIALK